MKKYVIQMQWVYVDFVVWFEIREINGMHKMCIPKYYDVGTYPRPSRAHSYVNWSFQRIPP